MTVFQRNGYSAVLDIQHGLMLVPLHDGAQTGALLCSGKPVDHVEIEFFRPLIERRAQMKGTEGIALDIGSCIGTWALPLSSFKGISQVHAFEPQRILCNMICGTMALNAVENVWVHNIAISDSDGEGLMQKLDYHTSTQFGSVEFGVVQGEKLSQTATDYIPTKVRSIDSFLGDIWFHGISLPSYNVHFIKLDVEGMECQALCGAENVILRSSPLMYVEWLKGDKDALAGKLEGWGYKLEDTGFNFICIPKDM